MMPMVPPAPQALALCHALIQVLRAPAHDSSPHELCQTLVLFAGSCLWTCPLRQWPRRCVETF
jgi:hypothetical protein